MLKPNSSVTTNLIKARELIADEKNWCRLDYKCGARYCAIGAVAATHNTHAGMWQNSMNADYEFLHKAGDQLFKRHPEGVNDFFVHAAVMQMFDRAIELSLQEAEAS